MRRWVAADRSLWLALLLVVPALLPLAAPGYFFKAHDAPHSIFFLVEFDQAIKSGVIWPVWAPDQAIGFGYPLWLVYAPLAYCAAELFHLAGLGFVTAVKCTWALCFILGALGTYLLARRWWGRPAALIASVAYTYAPYHLVQIYVRAALAEFAALALFPWVLLAFDRLWDGPRPRRLAAAGLALGALLLAHTVSQLLFVPLLGAFLLMKLLTAPPPRRTAWAAARWSAGAVALGLMLAAIFMAPAFFERSYVVQSQFVQENYSYLKQFVYPGQFFSPFWGFGYAVEGPADGMSLQLGALLVLMALAGAWAGLRPGPTELPHRAEALFLAAASLVCILAMTPAAATLWRALPLVSLIQFPWRLLTLTTITLALLAGLGAYWLERRVPDAVEPGSVASAPMAGAGASPYVYVGALALVLASFTYTSPQLAPIRPLDESPMAVIDFETRFPDMRGMMAWSQRIPQDADSPLLAQYRAGQPLQRAAILSGQGSILEQHADAASAYARVNASGSLHLRFYTYYFPGWTATLDGRPAQISIDPPNGLIGVDVPAGVHEVRVRFGATPLRAAAAAVTLAALAVVLVLLAVDLKKPRPPARHLPKSAI